MHYQSNSPFPYADNYYFILPKGLPEHFYSGDGDFVYSEDYVIYFKPDTPENIKNRLTKDYAEYHKKQIESGMYID